MFSKNDENPNGTATSGGPTDVDRGSKSRSAGVPSLISADLSVVGDLHCAGDIQIDGKVEGDIKSKTVTIGEGAQVKGSIAADRATLLGSINGEIRSDQVIIAKSAKVVGDIVHRSLSVEAGAILDGHCRRFETETAKTIQDNAKIAPLKPNQPGPIAATAQKESKPAAG